MADTNTDTNTSPLQHHCGQSLAGSDATSPPSSGVDDDNIDDISPLRPSTPRALPSTTTAPPMRPSSPTPRPVAGEDRAGPVGVNAEHGTATGSKQELEEDPVQYDPVSNISRDPGSGGSRPTRGVGWIRDEREVLCAVYVEATLNSEVGTDQRMETFKSDYCGRFRARLPDSLPQVERRRARATMAIDKKLKYNIFPMVESFKDLYLSVLNVKRTGNPTPSYLINATVAKHNGLSPYEGFQAEVVATLKCPALPYWRILRRLDRFSGAATVAALRASHRPSSPHGAAGAELCDEDPVDGLTDKDEDMSMGSSSSTYARGRQQRERSVFQQRPVGNKAAKASSRMEATLQRKAVANTVALNSLARSAAHRAKIAFWSSPAAANSDEGRQWWAREMRRRLQDADGYPAADSNAPTADEEAALQGIFEATTSAADAASPRSNGGGRGRGRGGFVGGERGARRGGGRCAAVVARGGRGGRSRGRGRGRGARLGRSERSSGRASSDDEEEETVSESDDDSADALPPLRLERTRAASRTTSPPP